MTTDRTAVSSGDVRLGVDVGGASTDAVLLAEDELAVDSVEYASATPQSATTNTKSATDGMKNIPKL